ncbi:hypothetical protein MNBD_GAMMA10-2440 [hydrothermal vent metagenome]|uniref:Uncharacterized protein n=1 Tax=hydrothermal vent metagenome TaxID=652676 RepID=A0A3B0XTZ5_9ZZZZ
MARTTDRHPVDDDIHIFKSDNSSRWFARFKVDTAWKTKFTKKRDQQQAIIKAIQLQAEYKTKAENNLSIFTRRNFAANTFMTIANHAIKRMEQETVNYRFLSMKPTCLRLGEAFVGKGIRCLGLLSA